jgi:formylglycine-generating enzyme required for sulfatase activity
VSDNSSFRRYFVDGLEGKADLSGDGYITGTELSQYLKDNVTNYTRGKQTPLFGKINDLELDRGEMIFAVPLQVRLENEKKADEAWARTVRNDPTSLDLFARTYPGSRHAPEALERIEKLGPATRAGVRSDAPRTVVEPVRRAPEALNLDFQTATYDSKGVITKSKKTTTGFREELGGGAKIEMVKVPAGKFRMGSNVESEKPIREVTVDEFHISATEITQAQWRAIAKTKRINIELDVDPSWHTGEALPVESITWEEAKEFCARLSRETGRVYDLPSEAEWEYAARGGSVTERPFGEKIGSEVANYDALPRADAFTKYSMPGSRRDETIAAGSLKIANAFGLYDMLGNVAEWCLDSWQTNYQGAPPTAASRETNSRKRVVRGGSYNTLPSELTVSHRKGQDQDEQYQTTGFRIVLRAPK